MTSVATRPASMPSNSRNSRQSTAPGVPTLGEVFELANKAANRAVRFNIEVKINPEYPQLTFPPDEFVRTVVDVIRSYEMEHRVVLQSFDWRALQVVHILPRR